MRRDKGCLVVVTCLLLLLFSFTENDSFAACPSPARIVGNAYVPTSIQDAYDYASFDLGLSEFTLQLAGEIFNEDLTLDGGAVVLDGGYDCTFSTKTSTTGILGTVTIGTGSVNWAGGIGVKSSTLCDFDIDGDGFTSVGSCAGTADDCNDNNPNIYPGALEICDGVDNDCNGQVDEGGTPVDADGDGYFDAGSCGAIVDDCNDSNGNIHPGALDIPYDGIDQDCNGADLTFVDPNNCEGCHVPPDGMASLHTGSMAPDITCAICHTPPVSNILSGHYGKTVRTAGNNMTAGSTISCYSCHDADSSTHSGGIVLGNGSNFVWTKAAAALPSITCDSCHENRLSGHATATAHDHRIIDSSCGDCHTSDPSVLGYGGFGTLASAADVDSLHGVVSVASCAICHKYTGTQLNTGTVRQTIEQGLGGNPTTCTDCHTDQLTNHYEAFAHSGEVGPNDLSYEAPGQLCGNCHVVATWAQIDTIEHNVPTNGAGSCATCHNSTRQEVIDTIASGARPTHCLDCHPDQQLTDHVDHVALDYVTDAAACLACHDSGSGSNATVVGAHGNNCALCHTTGPDLQPGLPAGGGDCTTCHTEAWEATHAVNTVDHSTLVQVATTSCADCHDDTLVSAATDTHNACSSCHDIDGGLISLAVGTSFASGGDCATCHSGTWEAEHTPATDHTAIVTVGSTNCADCHDDTLVGAAATTHNACSSCHDAATGGLIGSAVGTSFASGGDCSTCHAGTWGALHPTTATVHTSLVTVGSTGCADCHDDTLVSAAADTHNACASCHDASTGGLIGSAAGTSFASGGDCATCHSGTWEAEHAPATDHTALVTVGSSSCADCHDDTLVSAATDTHNACASCHDADGGLIGSAVGTSFATGGDCATCHSGSWESEHATHSHTVQEGSGDLSFDPPGQPCSNCHVVATWAEIDTIEHNVDTNGAGSCATCHNSPRQEVIDAIALGADPTVCLDCHSGKLLTIHGNDDHGALGYVAAGATNCLTCHDPGAAFDGTVTVIHLGNCSLCHTSPPSLQPGIPAGGGDCLTCHTDTWELTHTTNTPDHGLLVQVATTSCADCHDDTLVSAAADTHNACASCHDANGGLISLAVGTSFATGGDCATCHSTSWEALHPTTAFNHSGIVTVGATSCAACHDDTLVSAAAETHNACSSCHEATTGALIGSATGQTGPGDCTSCHAGTWEIEHTTAIDHTALVTVGATSCAACHDDTLVSAAVETHNACASCHDATTGALIGSAVGSSFATGGDCATCHAGSFDNIHTGHAHTVALGAGDLADGVSCGDCHAAATWAEVDTEHNVATNGAGPCATCHNSSRQEVNDTIALGANPTNCLPCHSNKETGHGSIDHVALGYVAGGPATCLTCHDPGAAEDATVVVTHLGNCSLCHTTVPALQPGIPAGGGDCATCHSGTWEAEHTPATDHSALVTIGSSSCADCHDDILVSAAADTHNACSSCHDTDGGLVSLAVGTSFATGGDCATCHSTGWEALHPTTAFNHSGIVTVGATSCAACHDDTLVSAAVETHNACSSCHDATTGALIGSATGQTGPGDCTTCHGGTWEALHPTTAFNHSGIVTVGATSCAVCHDDTLVSAAVETHNTCSSCHDATTGALVGSATGQTAPGDCTSCHAGTWEAEHTTAIDHTALVVVGSSSCAACHDDTLVSAAVETHNACASCHDATTGALIGSAVGSSFATGGDCVTCHASGWEPEHTPALSHAALVTVGSSGCAACHDDTLVSGATDTHNACSSCHDVNGGLIGSAVGSSFATGGDCATCHATTWEALHPTTAFNHGGIVTVGATSCADCHDNTLVSAAAETHNTCTSCHDANSGVLIGSAAGQAAPGDCATCHAGSWDALHASHGHTVALGAGDLSGSTPCGSCHAVANWLQIDTRHNVATNGAGSCATCHNSPRQEAIDAIALAANPTNCLDCHSDKTVPHAAHVAAGYVTVGGIQDYYGTTCASCHDPGGTTNETVDVTHNGDCTLCHTTVPNLQPGIPAGGGDCVTCHTPSEHTLWNRYMACSTSSCHAAFDGGPGSALHDAHNPAGGWSDRNSATSGLSYPNASNPEMWIDNWPLNPDCATCHTAFDDTTRDQGCGNCHNFPGKKDLHGLHSDRANKGGLEIACNFCHQFQ